MDSISIQKRTRLFPRNKSPNSSFDSFRRKRRNFIRTLCACKQGGALFPDSRNARPLALRDEGLRKRDHQNKLVIYTYKERKQKEKEKRGTNDYSSVRLPESTIRGTIGWTCSSLWWRVSRVRALLVNRAETRYLEGKGRGRARVASPLASRARRDRRTRRSTLKGTRRSDPSENPRIASVEQSRNSAKSKYRSISSNLEQRLNLGEREREIQTRRGRRFLSSNGVKEIGRRVNERASCFPPVTTVDGVFTSIPPSSFPPRLSIFIPKPRRIDRSRFKGGREGRGIFARVGVECTSFYRSGKGERKVGARSFQIRSSSIQPAGGLTPILPPLNERKREGKRERERGPEGFDSSAGCDTLVLVVRPPSPSSWTELKWEPIYTHRGHPNPFFSFLFPSFHSPTLRPISDRRLNIIIFRGGRQTILPISAK